MKLTTRYFWILLTSLLLSFTPTLHAQEEEAAGEAATEEAAEGEGEAVDLDSDVNFWQLIQQGGWAMWPLGALSVAMCTFMILNFLSIRRGKLIPDELVPYVGNQVANHDFVNAMDTCNANPCMLTSVVGAGLERITGDELDVENVKTAMEAAETEQMVSYMGRISYLSIIGAVAPMVGLLGTVSGMIKAFQAISKGGMGDPSVLASNIGEALVTTATGLVIAIPAMICYFILKNKFMSIMASMARISGTMIDAMETGELTGYGPAAYAPADEGFEPGVDEEG